MREPYQFESLTLSSLEKVLPAQQRPGRRYTHATMLKNERFHYQIAIKAITREKAILSMDVSSPLADSIALFEVGMVPCELAQLSVSDARDTNYIGGPGIYPDILEAINPVGLQMTPRQWKTVWVTVAAKDGETLSPGRYPIDISFYCGGEKVAGSHFDLEVLDVELDAQRLIYTNWLHLDTIATYYGVEIFSEAHWELIEEFLRMAVSRGVNMILTPCLTPPLDTAVGGERPTVQLVDVWEDGGTYAFGFEKLTRFIALCRRYGVQYFEVAHLFTQWGAYYAPKVMAFVNGEYTRIFGWDTPAASDAYAGFLKAFLPALIGYFREMELADRVFFHISDEPREEHLDSYGAAAKLVEGLLEGFPVIDALSDYSFYERGLVKIPVPAIRNLDIFTANGISPRWCYYCAFNCDFLSMRYFSTPSARNRIFGYQLYKYDVDGFLHWGYNFYYAQYSLYPVDPYRNSDSGGWCPSGDNHVVYPGEDGPVPSLRLEVFADALQDLRALRTLEARIGRDKVLALLESELFVPLSMYDYPKDDEWILQMRERVNRTLAQQT